MLNDAENKIGSVIDMYRKFTEKLQKWQDTQQKKSLMVIGARQTGKTWCIKDFCDMTFKDYICINLEKKKDFQSLFNGSPDPDTIISGIEQMLSRKITADTPIFFL